MLAPISEIPKDRCRFDMFTVLRPGLEKNFANQKREWTYKGDKFTDEPPKMLQSLLRMMKNHAGKWSLVELYDNTRPRNDPDRIIVRLKEGIIEKNILETYHSMLTDFVIPDFLK